MNQKINNNIISLYLCWAYNPSKKEKIILLNFSHNQPEKKLQKRVLLAVCFIEPIQGKKFLLLLMDKKKKRMIFVTLFCLFQNCRKFWKGVLTKRCSQRNHRQKLLALLPIEGIYPHNWKSQTLFCTQIFN